MRRTYLTLVALIALIACRDRAPEPAPPPPVRDGVTLIQPGVPPLQTLRYHLTRGSKTTSRLVCDVDMTSGERLEPMPTQVVDLETTVEDMRADGAARLRIAVVDATVRDRAGSAVPSNVMQAQAAALRGVVITETLGPDGRVSDAHVEGGGSDKLHSELDSLVRGLEHVATRLPAEPVGVGATWRERRTLPEGGIRAVSEITYTLASITGGTVAYTSIGESSGEPQTLEQDGAKVEVTGTHGRSEATGTLDLSRYALDVTATSMFATTMAVVAPAAGPGAAAGGERSTIEIAMAIRMSSADARTPAAGAPVAPASAAPAPAAPEAAAPEPAAPEPEAAAPGDATPSPNAAERSAQGAHSAP